MGNELDRLDGDRDPGGERGILHSADCEARMGGDI